MVYKGHDNHYRIISSQEPCLNLSSSMKAMGLSVKGVPLEYTLDIMNYGEGFTS